MVSFQSGMCKIRPGHLLKHLEVSGPEPLVDLFNFTINTLRIATEENSNKSNVMTSFVKLSRLSWLVMSSYFSDPNDREI